MVRLANLHKKLWSWYHQLTRRVPRNAENSVSKKLSPILRFLGGAGTEKMVQSMINALQAEVGQITQPEPVPEQPDETVSEADAEANKAIEYLNNVMDMQSTDMAEIRNARGNVREAIAALQAAGRFEENEELVNGAARHLADLLVAIQKAGVAA